MESEKDKANKKFTALMEKTIVAAKTSRSRKIEKIMSTTDSAGNVYDTEMEIMDAYAYEMITDNERHRLLKALEFKEDHPYMMEDHLISLCHRALRLIDYDDIAKYKAEKAKAIKSMTAEIERNGSTALPCGCCGAIVGELARDGQRHEYPEYTNCSRGRVCIDCLHNCQKQCKERD